jgi:hypothetical protein
LNSALQAQGQHPVISRPLHQQIEKRVPPSTLANYLTFGRAISLCMNEFELIATRIRQYPMINVYPEYFSSKDRAVFAAFLTHLHSLRANELYLIQERGCQLLKFVHVITSGLGLESFDQSRVFEKAFKKEFWWRLRERHRLTHMHERPSLMTRMLDVIASDIDKETLTDALADLVINLSTLFDSLKSMEDEDVNFGEVREEMERAHDEGFGKESLAAWRLIKLSFRATCPTLFRSEPSASRHVAPRS